MSTLWDKRNLAALSEENGQEHPEATWHGTQNFSDHKKTTSFKFLMKLRVELQKSSSRSLVVRRTQFRLHYPLLMTFL